MNNTNLNGIPLQYRTSSKSPKKALQSPTSNVDHSPYRMSLSSEHSLSSTSTSISVLTTESTGIASLSGRGSGFSYRSFGQDNPYSTRAPNCKQVDPYEFQEKTNCNTVCSLNGKYSQDSLSTDQNGTNRQLPPFSETFTDQTASNIFIPSSFNKNYSSREISPKAILVSEFEKMSFNPYLNQQGKTSNQDYCRYGQDHLKQDPDQNLSKSRSIQRKMVSSKVTSSNHSRRSSILFAESSQYPLHNPYHTVTKTQINTGLSVQRIINNDLGKAADFTDAKARDEPLKKTNTHWDPLVSAEDVKRRCMVQSHGSSESKWQTTQKIFSKTEPLQINQKFSHGYHGYNMNETVVDGKTGVQSSGDSNCSTPPNYWNSPQNIIDSGFDVSRNKRGHSMSSTVLSPITGTLLTTGSYNMPDYPTTSLVTTDNERHTNLSAAHHNTENIHNLTTIRSPTYEDPRRCFSPAKNWKYHIQKNMGNFFMTTNPDLKHINAPKAPLYHVQIRNGEEVLSKAITTLICEKKKDVKNLISRTFTMSLVNMDTQFEEVSITRCFRNDLHGGFEDFYDITVFKQPDQDDQNNEPELLSLFQAEGLQTGYGVNIKENSGPKAQTDYSNSEAGFKKISDTRSIVAWRAQAFAVPSIQYYGIQSSSSMFDFGSHYKVLKPMIANAGASFERELHNGINSLASLTGHSFGEKARDKEFTSYRKDQKDNDSFRQYEFLDNNHKKWVVGNREVHFDSDSMVEDDSDDSDDSGPSENLDDNITYLTSTTNERCEVLSTTSTNNSEGGLSVSSDPTKSSSKRIRIKKRSKRVYFFSPGLSGPQSDKMFAVLQRRKQIHQQIGKDISRIAHRATTSISEPVTEHIERRNKAGQSVRGESHESKDDSSGSFEISGQTKFKTAMSSLGLKRSANPVASIQSSTFGYCDQQEHLTPSQSLESSTENQSVLLMATAEVEDSSDPVRMDKDEDENKFGWLTMLEKTKKQAGLWPIVISMTMAVAYSQRMDDKERSLHVKMKGIGGRYSKARRSMYSDRINSRN